MNYQLIGSFVANDNKHSYVVLATANGTQKLYRVGANIPGGAKIIKVLPKSVVLKHNGRLETLSLPRDSLNFDGKPQGLNLQQLLKSLSVL